MTQPGAASRVRFVESPTVGVVRQTVDLVVVLCLGVLMFRTFAAEAYVVPTGSMAPTLMGHHRELTCPNCQYPFIIGLDEEGRPPRAVCPNCGKTDLDDLAAVECNGDRVLVQKFLYDFRAPRRWEVSVFHFPSEPTQAYVKRVVGLPNESIQIVDGDVVADKRIARKTLAEQRAMRLLVHDSRYVPADSDRFPRWFFLRGTPRRRLSTGWAPAAGSFVHAPAEPAGGDPDDWLVYRHWDPVAGHYGPIRDHYAYNGNDLNSANIVPDLALEARLTIEPDVEQLSTMIRAGGDRFIVRIPTGGHGRALEVVRNERRLVVTPRANPLLEAARATRTVRLEASVFDRRLIVAIDGVPVFDPLDYDDPAPRPRADESPIALGVGGGHLTVNELRLYRDVYYTDTLSGMPRRPHGVGEPYRLGPDEYFVLGDNSPVSNDSRFWTAGPVVPRSLFLGKPFLVHLPGQVVPLEVFGRSVYWVPDPRRIRYIH